MSTDSGKAERTILAVAAHPDDEILGCGGTLARHAAEGDMVHVMIVAEGATSRNARLEPHGREPALAALRAASSRAAAIIGACEPHLLGLPDNRLDSLPLLDVIRPIEAVVGTVTPEIVYTHHAGDLNVDHRIVHQATVTACRPLPESPVRAIYAFETVSSTEWQSGGDPFRPQRWVNIEPFLSNKRRALEAYVAEISSFPHARSFKAIDALARVRGATAGLKAAECFMVVREVAP
ncbi:MAG: PIG-L family deacetylase [Rhodospirillaceae bacterium]|nr:PIG-L family deacetylase [Rhodospirillaceae bacterium]